jgi:hypothetical protein
MLPRFVSSRPPARRSLVASSITGVAGNENSARMLEAYESNLRKNRSWPVIGSARDTSYQGNPLDASRMESSCALRRHLLQVAKATLNLNSGSRAYRGSEPMLLNSATAEFAVIEKRRSQHQGTAHPNVQSSATQSHQRSQGKDAPTPNTIIIARLLRVLIQPNYWGTPRRLNTGCRGERGRFHAQVRQHCQLFPRTRHDGPVP